MSSTVKTIISGTVVLLAVVAIVWIAFPREADQHVEQARQVTAVATTETAPADPSVAAATSGSADTTSAASTVSAGLLPDTEGENGHIVGTGTVQASNADVSVRPVPTDTPNREQLLSAIGGLLTQYYSINPDDTPETWKARVAPYVTDPSVLGRLRFDIGDLSGLPAAKRLEAHTTTRGVFDMATLQAEPGNGEMYILITVTLQTTGPDGTAVGVSQSINSGTSWRLTSGQWQLSRLTSSDPVPIPIPEGG